MPSTSQAQHNLMEAAAHGAKWAQKKVAPKVAQEFVMADMGRKLAQKAKTETKK